MSHDIDFKSMGSADTWYGHWEYSDLEWKIIKGRKKFYINREPYSTHINLLRKNNFKIVSEIKNRNEDTVELKKLSKTSKNLDASDLTTSSVFFQAIGDY